MKTSFHKGKTKKIITFPKYFLQGTVSKEYDMNSESDFFSDYQ